MIDIIILIKLISAHLVGDFIFQSDKMCRNKNSVILKTRLQWIGLHAIIQGFFTYIFLADWNNWEIPILIIITHYLIDFIKIKTNSTGFIAFIWDQLSHYLVILLIWWGFYIIGPCYYGIDNYVFSLKTWIIFSSFITILTPTAIFIKLFLNFENWTPVGENFKGLPNAGKWIGFLERILILIFIYTDNIEGVGFLLAAKSIFRFGELNKARDLKITEYVLIGTFLSFTIAIMIGYGTMWLIQNSYE